MIKCNDQGTTKALDAQALLRCHCVLRMAARVETADITDANAVFVVASDVCARPCNRSAALDGAVEPHDVVVPNVGPIAWW